MTTHPHPTETDASPITGPVTGKRSTRRIIGGILLLVLLLGQLAFFAALHGDEARRTTDWATAVVTPPVKMFLVASILVSLVWTYLCLRKPTAASLRGGPRRKWGWFFVVAYLLLVIASVATVGFISGNIYREQELAAHFAEGGHAGQSMINSLSAERMRNEKSLLMIAASILLAGTLAGAVVGLRRRT